MDVVTIGESMILFTPDSVGPLRFVNKFSKTIGGAESNVAIALSRLGHSTGWISRLGDDEFGLYLRNYIRGEGVDTSQVIFDKQHFTSIYFKERKISGDPKVYYYRKGSATSFMSPIDLDKQYIMNADYLYVTGITPALSQSCNEVINRAINIAVENEKTVIFDPNIRLKLWSQEEASRTLKQIATRCDIILTSLDEGTMITGEENPEKVSESFLNMGARIVVVKMGEKGAYFQDDQGQRDYVQANHMKHVVDTVGAGDGFNAGFISGLIRGFKTREAVELGNRVGAFALTVTGDVEGYPLWSQIENRAEILR
ncbi:sugar kinase [Sporolactobacillus sp. THM7-4]|nr:sugar kinase [Sporolactobacillus sp. THM7-4]